ncbi:prestin-like isoform X2 [Babylonia areolata]|uniref:prestin-like isoform X2 n=1 Tax=Babylonia areolata TaxID=304850 RepID=UPI003FCFBCF3
MPVYVYRRGNRSSDDNENEESIMVDEMVVVERPILTELDFEQGFERMEKPARTPLTWMKKQAGKCVCSCVCLKRFLLQVFPFIRLLRGYSPKTDLPSDIVAGLTVGIMHIPQGMAYGQLSTLPPVYGLYVSFFPVILYFFLGTSNHVSVGTFAVVSLMVGSVVDKGMTAKGIVLRQWNETLEDNGNMTHQLMDNSAEVLQAKLGLAMAVTFAVGCVQLLLGVLRLGFLTVYLSDPLISGFTTGASCHVFTSQIKHIFGLHVGRYYGAFKLIYSYRDFFVNIPTTNSVTIIASGVCILVLVVVKEYINNNPKIKPRLKMPIPIELIVVVLGTVISYFVNLQEEYNVEIVGDVPIGIPPPKAQQFGDLKDVVADSIALGIVAFAISVSMAKILAKKHDYDIDSNQELLAYGIVNITSSFFSSFCASASLSRSLVQDNVGGKTQVAGLVSSALLLVVLLVLGSYFRTLPNCILAAIIIVALKGMFKQFLELKRLWNISIIDFSVWFVSFLATVLLDVDLGLMIGIIFALLTVIIRQQRPRACLLGQVPGTDLYKDMSIIKAAEPLEHIKIFRFESALFFANSEYFKTSIYKLTADPAVLKKLKKKADKELLKVQVIPLRHVTESEPAVTPPEEQTADGNNGDDSPADPVTMTTADSNGDASNQTSLLNERGTDSPIVLPTVTDVYFVIIDCTTMGYVDSVGVKVLQQVITEMRSYSIQVFFAQCKAAVREMFEKTDFYKTSDKQCLFLTVHDAVLYAQRLLAIVEGEEDGERISLESIQEHSISGSTEAKLNNGGVDASSAPTDNGGTV